MVRIQFKYVYEDVDRRGNVRLYFWRRPGGKIRIKEALGGEAFVKRHQELLQLSDAGPLASKIGPDRPRHNTFGWLIEAYLRSVAANALDPSTLRVRSQILGHCCAEPVFQGSSESYAHFPLPRISTKVLRVLRDRKAGLPEAANGRVKAIRAVFKWGLAEEHVSTNPARDLLPIENRTDGFQTWTLDDVEAYQKRHATGTMARLAFDILLFTGLRRSDLVQLGRQHLRAGWIRKPQHKGRKRSPMTLEMPVLPALAEAIAAGPAGDMTLLLNGYGRPFAIAGFGNWFRDRCNEAGLPELSAHGMRKAGATLAAEQGATPHELMAIFGWKSLAEAELYTRKVDRKKLAAAGMAKLMRGKS